MSTKQSGQHLNSMKSNGFVRIGAIAAKVMYQKTDAGREFVGLYNQLILLPKSNVSARSRFWQ
jgi:hypothetical protein